MSRDPAQASLLGDELPPSPPPVSTRLYEVPAGAVSRPCKGCGKPIFYVETLQKRWMPVDCESEEAVAAGARVPTRLEGGVGLSHFQTCPEVSRFSKASKGQASRDRRGD